MFLRKQMMTIAIAMGFLSGCGHSASDALDTLHQNGACVNCYDNNGPGHYIGDGDGQALTVTRNWIPLGLDRTFRLSALQSGAGVFIVGMVWGSPGSTPVTAMGPISGVMIPGGESWLPIKSFGTSGTDPVIVFPGGNTISGKDTVGIRLKGFISWDSGGGSESAELWFEIGGAVSSASGIHQYGLKYSTSGIGSDWPDLCIHNGATERVVFLGTDQVYHHYTAVATQSAGAVTVSCTSGSIAQCNDEYKYTVSSDPHRTFSLDGGGEVEMLKVHHACMYMKTAQYKSVMPDSHGCTHEGVTYGKYDILLPMRIQNDTILDEDLEAFWTDSGAACLNASNIRDSSMCPTYMNSLPDCSTLPASYLLASSKPLM